MLDALDEMGIEVPTPIQALAIGAVLDGRDVIAKAETGTGKTLAFGAPLMAKMDITRTTVLALVLCPTRELAQQVAEVLQKIAEFTGGKVVLVVGGDPMREQIQRVKAGAQVIVGTPGRVLDLLRQRYVAFPWLEFAVLDEADKMFEIGFLDDIRAILAYTPKERQTLLFSATYVNEVLQLAREATVDPVEIATAKGVATVDNIEQLWIDLDEQEKPDVLERIIEESEEDDTFLVFCERRTDVDGLLRRLSRSPWRVTALHGGYDQSVRFRVIQMFRDREIKVLIATDVAARGLDVVHVTHVINYQIPREVEEYTHRIGRTGRAGRTGTAISFVAGDDWRRWKHILKQVDWDIVEIDPPRPRRRGRPQTRGRPASSRRPPPRGRNRHRS